MKKRFILSWVFFITAIVTTFPASALERATEYLRTFEETNVSIGAEYVQGDYGTDQNSYYFPKSMKRF